MKYKIVNRKRFIAFCLAVLLLAGCCTAAAVNRVFAKEEPRLQEIRVVPGDTLWRIAAEYGDPGDDIRNTIIDIQKINGLKGPVIYAGQTLLVPDRSRE